MAANSSIMILIFEMVLYLTAVTSVELPDFEPIAKEVKIAIEQMDLPGTMKVVFSYDYINVGGYSNSFIELLDTYSTMSRSPVGFDEKEKLSLTLSSAEDPTEYKVGAQLKYYRKMQEIQCTGYLILNHYLLDANFNARHVIRHVYNMIEMAYLGKFLVFEWLLKLYINLLAAPRTSRFTTDGLFDLERYKKTSGELVSMCVKHNYLENGNSKERFSAILEHDNFNTLLHVRFNNNKSPLPFSFDYLYLSNIRQWEQLFVPITSQTTEWNTVNNEFKQLIIDITEQLSTENWIKDPFKYIKFQQTFLDGVKLRLYCYIWIKILVYLKVTVSDYEYRLDFFYRLDYFMSMISDLVEFVRIEDKTLNAVLTSHGTHKKGEANYEENYKLLVIVSERINSIRKTMGLPEDAIVCNVIDDDLKTEHTFISYLDNIEKSFMEFGNFLRTTLDGYSLNVLLFFVDGIRHTELAVFPRNNFYL